jgi:hypothetical protein
VCKKSFKNEYYSMKKILLYSFLVIVTQMPVSAQIISKFTWETLPVTTAVVGPNANSVSTSATSSAGGTGVTKGLNAGTPTMDINLTFSSPASLALFDGLPGIDISVDFKRKEGTASFFTRGASLDFGITGGNLFVNYLYSNGAGGSVAVNSGTIAAVPTDNLFHNYRFTYDNSLGKATVRVDGAIVYTFTGVAGRAIYWTGAGNVVIGKLMDGSGSNVTILDNMIISVPGTLLPLTLLSFSANLNNNTVYLNWSTGTEINTDHFEIEKSADGIHFLAFQQVAAAGGISLTQKYIATDPNPSYDDTYYRLKMVDKDGKFTYSPVVHISKHNGEKPVIYPNPAKDHVWLKFNNSITQNYTLSIYTTDSKKLSTESLKLAPGFHQVNVKLPDSGGPQLLFITLNDEGGLKQVFTVVKQ